MSANLKMDKETIDSNTAQAANSKTLNSFFFSSTVIYVSFAEPVYEVVEGAGSVQVCLVLTQVVEATADALWVSISTEDGTAEGE